MTRPATRQLPLWEERLRALPNAFARSALFTAANGRKQGERRQFKDLEVASVAGYKLVYSGEELRQDDEDVFLQALHLARHHDIDTGVCFTASSLLGSLGWTHNSRSYERIRTTLLRLQRANVRLLYESDERRRGFAGQLVRKLHFEEPLADLDGPRGWRLWLEPEILVLFGPDTYSRLDWEQRLALPPLAKWLHSFYITHREPYPYKVATIKSLCGSQIKELRQFRYELKKALALLEGRRFFQRAYIDVRTDCLVAVRIQNQLRHSR